MGIVLNPFYDLLKFSLSTAGAPGELCQFILQDQKEMKNLDLMVSVLCFRKAEIQQNQLNENDAPSGTSKHMIPSMKYQALLALMTGIKNLLSEPSIGSIGKANVHKRNGLEMISRRSILSLQDPVPANIHN